jgi:hypothetical protein
VRDEPADVQRSGELPAADCRLRRRRSNMWQGGGVRCAHRESSALRALWGRLLEARRSYRARHAERLCKWGRFIGN